MQANVEAVRVAGLVTTLVSMAGDNRRMDSLPNSVGPRVSTCMSLGSVSLCQTSQAYYYFSSHLIHQSNIDRLHYS